MMINGYLQKFDIEDDEGDEEREYQFQYSSDEEDAPPRKITYKPSSIKNFLHVMRTTRGYGFDRGLKVAGIMDCPFSLYSEEDICNFGVYVNAAVELAIKEINLKTGNAYKHVKTLKVVDTPHRILLLTFTAAAKFTEKKKKTGKKEKKTKVEREHTFLAGVSTPGPAPHLFKVLECFRKPKDPAPWKYIES